MADGKTMPYSFEEQGDIIWTHIGEILKSTDMGYENIIQLRTYLASPDDDEANVGLRIKYLGNNEPASTVICCQLLETKWKLEIEAIAAQQIIEINKVLHNSKNRIESDEQRRV